MSSPPQPTRAASEKTREALIDAGLDQFGAKGFEATSTRDLAAAANANIASIAYHFGGKDGLRIACAAAIVARLSTAIALATGQLPVTLTPESAADRLETAIRTMVTFMIANPQAEPIAAFILREMTQPSAALDK
ncbi:MAG: CerR family C-terminal domain-containing protein, partial [Alphaproteobacteria bacterium]